MPHIHYKFSSKLSSDTVIFDGQHITLKELKRQIMDREKLRSGDCDLQITNAQTKEEYADDEGLIPKGSSVIIRRIPIIGVKSRFNGKTRHIERSDAQIHHTFGAIKAMDTQSSLRAIPLFSKMANLADVDVPEEDKINALIKQSTYDSVNYNVKSGAGLPANYTCYRCGNTGHHIRNCPTSADKNFEAPLRLKKSTGIPRSFMVEVDDPNIKGAMLTNSGHYAIPAMHAKAYAVSKKEKLPFAPQEQPASEDEDPVPDELICMICNELLSDAVVIPCCGNSFCDDCIRTALLDSDEHVCPKCSQSDVSPDSLIANKFLRQAVNTFQKERGHAKSLKGWGGASQSQNPTWALSPVPTLPPLTVQSQPQKPHQSSHSQQAAGTPPSSQVCGAPPTATCPAPASTVLSTSQQPVQSHQEASDKESEEKTNDDSAGEVPSALESPKDAAAAASQVTDTAAVEQSQTDSVTLQQSSDPAPRPNRPSTCWESSVNSSYSSSGYATGSWSESNTPSSSSYPATPSPLFPSPHFQTFIPAQQPVISYPPRYPPATSTWRLQTPQRAPIPPLCPSTTEWYMHQRRKNERSPHRGSTYRRSSSHSKSKSKSSRSYSHSSSGSRSRSRSRSRSHSRSRPRPSNSHHRDLHTHSRSSYSYGYKRSPTPSSSSSPRLSHRSRSKSPSAHRKRSHHSRHDSKKSASSRHSSRRRGESNQREAEAPEKSFDLNAQNEKKNKSPEWDIQRYLQWKREYKEWCDKYFNSYVTHFHLMPPPLLDLPPTPLAQWGDTEGNKNYSCVSTESSKRLQDRSTARMDDCCPPSHSSSGSRSTPYQSSSDSHSSPSHSSNDSRSPPSQSSSDGHSTPSKLRAHQKYNRLPVTLTKGSKDAELQKRRKDDTLKYQQRSIEKFKDRQGDVSSSPDAEDSMGDWRKDQRRHNTGPNACKDGNPSQDKATASEALESVQPLVKSDKSLDKDYERKCREQRNLEIEKGRGQCSVSREDAERHHKEKASKGARRVKTDGYRNPRSNEASDSTLLKTQKRKGEDMERGSAEAQSSKCLMTNISEVPQTCESKSHNPFDRKKPKIEKEKERKVWPLTEQYIWEGGMKVKSHKRISINISLDGKRKEEKTDKKGLPSLESTTGKTKEEIEKMNNREMEKLNREGSEVNEKKDSSSNQEGESKLKIKLDERDESPIWEKTTSSDHKGQVWEKTAGEKKGDMEEEDSDLLYCALGGEEEDESKKQWQEHNVMKASNEEKTTKDESMKEGKEEEGSERSGVGGQEMGEFVAVAHEKRTGGERTCKVNRGNPRGESKPQEELMEELEVRISEKEDTTNTSLHDGPNTTLDDGRYENCQERKMVVKTLEEYTQDRAADSGDELILGQVPCSPCKKEESVEEERSDGKAQTEVLLSSSVSVTAETSANRETERENNQQRHREMERDKARVKDRGPDRKREKNTTLSSSHRSVAPPSGKGKPDSTLFTMREWERETRKGMETPKDGERGRERPKDRQRERRISKEKTWEKEIGRDRKRDRESSSSHSYSTSHDTKRKNRQQGDDQGSNRSSCCPGGKSSSGSSLVSTATKLPAHTRGMFQDLKIKDKDHSLCYHNPQAHSGNNRHKDRPAQEVMPSRSRNESMVEKEEWKQRRADEVGKEGKWLRGNQDILVKKRRACQWEDEADKLHRQTKWELEEGERSSSSKSGSSSASQESSSDDRRKEWKKKQKKHKKEKRQAVAPELLEDRELKKHKESKRSRDGGEW